MKPNLARAGYYATLVLKGMAYGITHIVPGIGGGLMLVALGIYEQFVDAVGNVLFQRERRREHITFLLVLGSGMVLAMLGLSRIIVVIAERYPVPLSFFFIGMLVGTIPGILRSEADMRPTVGRVLALLLGLVMVVGFRLAQRRFGATEAAQGATESSLYIAFISFIAGGASVTPGLDGTYIWMLAGVYQTVIGAIGNLTRLVVEWAVLIPAGIGSVAGILAFARLIDSIFKRAPSLAYYAVLGLVGGAVYGLWPQDLGAGSAQSILAAFAAGAVLVLLLGRRPEPEPAIVPVGVRPVASEDAAGPSRG